MALMTDFLRAAGQVFDARFTHVLLWSLALTLGLTLSLLRSLVKLLLVALLVLAPLTVVPLLGLWSLPGPTPSSMSRSSKP